MATRNDLGTLASIHNKMARLALVRLRLSMKEFLGTLPPETEALYREVTRPDSEAPPRLFAPTRPTMLAAGETVRVMVVAGGEGAVRNVALHVRPRGAAEWSTVAARLVGRRTFDARLGPFQADAALAEYYFSGVVGSQKVTAPPEPATHPYLLTLV